MKLCATPLFLTLLAAMPLACSSAPAKHVEVERPPELLSGQSFYNQIKAGTDDAQDWFVIYAETEMTVALNIRLDKQRTWSGLFTWSAATVRSSTRAGSSPLATSRAR